MKTYKHSVTLPDGTVETRTSENRRYFWATVAVVIPGTHDKQIKSAETDLAIAKARLDELPEPTPELEAEHAELKRQYDESYAKPGLSYFDPGYKAEARERRQSSDRYYAHPITRRKSATEHFEAAQARLERKKQETLHDFVIGYSQTRESALKRSTKWQEKNGYMTRVMPVTVVEHETKSRGPSKTVPGSTKSHKAVLAVLPEVGVPVGWDQVEKACGLTWRAFSRALRELRAANLVTSGVVEGKYSITRIA